MKSTQAVFLPLTKIVNKNRSLTPFNFSNHIKSSSDIRANLGTVLGLTGGIGAGTLLSNLLSEKMDYSFTSAPLSNMIFWGSGGLGAVLGNALGSRESKPKNKEEEKVNYDRAKAANIQRVRVVNPFNKNANTPVTPSQLLGAGHAFGVGSAAAGAGLGGGLGYLAGGAYNLFSDGPKNEDPKARQYRENRNRLRAALLGAVLGGGYLGLKNTGKAINTTDQSALNIAAQMGNNTNQ